MPWALMSVHRRPVPTRARVSTTLADLPVCVLPGRRAQRVSKTWMSVRRLRVPTAEAVRNLKRDRLHACVPVVSLVSRVPAIPTNVRRHRAAMEDYVWTGRMATRVRVRPAGPVASVRPTSTSVTLLPVPTVERVPTRQVRLRVRVP